MQLGGKGGKRKDKTRPKLLPHGQLNVMTHAVASGQASLDSRYRLPIKALAARGWLEIVKEYDMGHYRGRFFVCRPTEKGCIEFSRFLRERVSKRRHR